MALGLLEQTLGFLSDLIAQHLYVNDVPAAMRRRWSIDGYDIAVTDDPTNEVARITVVPMLGPGDIRRYGASETAEDNGQAILDAIADVGAAVIPPGTWTVRQQITPDHIPFTLRGVGPASILQFILTEVTGDEFPIICQSDSCMVIGLKIVPSGSALAHDRGAIKFDGAQNGVVRDVWVDGFDSGSNAAVSITDSDRCRVDNLRVDGASSEPFAFEIAGTDNTVTHVTADGVLLDVDSYTRV